MSWWNAITSVVEDTANEFVEDVETGLEATSSTLNSVSDALQDFDEAIESVPVVGTLYDLTPVHTAVHLGSEWTGVAGELAGDIDDEMEGRHADWGHLGRQALAATADTAITIAASEIGGAGAAKFLGKGVGAAERLGMRTLGRDVAGELGAGGARSLSRRVADYGAKTAVKGTVGGIISAPLNASAHGVGINWDNRPHLQRELGHQYPPSSGRLGQGGNMDLRDASEGRRGLPNTSQRTPTGDMGNMDYVMGHASNRPVYTNIPHDVYTPPYQVSYKAQMNMMKQREMGNYVPPPPAGAVFQPRPMTDYDMINPHYSVNTNPRYTPQPVENPTE